MSSAAPSVDLDPEKVTESQEDIPESAAATARVPLDALDRVRFT